MSVGGGGETIMVVLRVLESTSTEVHSLHHAAGGHDPEHGVEEGVALPVTLVQGLGQTLIAGDVQLNTLTLAGQQEGLKVRGGRGGVASEEGAVREVFEGGVGGGHVGQQHELLHHAHGLQVLLGHYVHH